MRNLKRVLSLALACVMVIGMMVMTTGAADFDDAAEITNVEAVEVMAALGILEGDDLGNFNPDGILTREQAAKIICYMLMGPANAEKLSKNASIFVDVAAGRWSAGFIAYCANMGIIAGNGDGTFAPEGKLTGVAFGKMLLTALGYDATIEGYVNNGNWATNIATDLIDADIDAGIVLDLPLARDDAALMALNTIKAPLVKYESKGTNLSVNGAEINFGATAAEYLTTTLAQEQRISDRTLTNDGGYTIEFGEKYFPNLWLTEAEDAFGRPACTWTYQTKDIGTYVDMSLLVKEYVGGVKGKTAYGDIGKSIIDEYDLYVYVDGAVSTDITEADLSKTNNKDLKPTGNGVLTQVFIDHEIETVTFVVINTYLAEAVADYNTKSETVSLSVFTGIDDAGAEPKPETAPHKVASDDYDSDLIAGLKKDDKVLVTMAAPDHDGDKDYKDYTIMTIAEPEKVPGVSIGSYTGGASAWDESIWTLKTIKVGADTYKTAVKAVDEVEYLYNYSKEQLENNTYNLYLDPYGNVLGIEKCFSKDNYVFVVGYDVGSNVLAQAIDKALIITTEGEMKTVNAKEGKTLPSFTDDNAAVNTWFTYTIDNEGTYVLNAVATSQGSTSLVEEAEGDEKNLINSENVTLGFSSLDEDGAVVKNDDDEIVLSYAYGNANSVYITVDANDSITGNAEDSDGANGSIVKVNGVYAGIKNVDIVCYDLSEVKSTYGDKEEEPLANFKNGMYDTDADKDTDDKDYNNVFFMYDKNGYVTYAVVVGKDDANTNNKVFLTSGIKAKSWDSANRVYVYTYEAIVNGELTTIQSEVHTDDADEAVELAKGGLYEAEFDAQTGYITNMTTLAVTSDGEMDTADNADNGYARKTGIDKDKIVLKGATLWVITEKSNDNYVILGEDCNFFVENKTGMISYEEYDVVTSALAAVNTDDTYNVASVNAICDPLTGFAQTVIFDLNFEEPKDEDTSGIIAVTFEDDDTITATFYDNGGEKDYVDFEAKAVAAVVKAIEDAEWNITVKTYEDGAYTINAERTVNGFAEEKTFTFTPADDLTEVFKIKSIKDSEEEAVILCATSATYVQEDDEVKVTVTKKDGTEFGEDDSFESSLGDVAAEFSEDMKTATLTVTVGEVDEDADHTVTYSAG